MVVIAGQVERRSAPERADAAVYRRLAELAAQAAEREARYARMEARTKDWRKDVERVSAANRLRVSRWAKEEG